MMPPLAGCSSPIMDKMASGRTIAKSALTDSSVSFVKAIMSGAIRWPVIRIET